jgi:hypothetical protein
MEVYNSIIYMFLVSFVIGYFTMSIMLYSKSDFTWNLNKFYSALLMGWLMALAELFMHMDMMKSVDFIIILILLTSCSIYTVYLIREQDYIDEKQFLKSMIEHHSMAITMSEKILGKPELSKETISLAHQIKKSQLKEIELMKNLLSTKKM